MFFFAKYVSDRPGPFTHYRFGIPFLVSYNIVKYLGYVWDSCSSGCTFFSIFSQKPFFSGEEP